MPFFILRNQQIRDNLVAWIDQNWQRYEKHPLMVEIAPRLPSGQTGSFATTGRP